MPGWRECKLGDLLEIRHGFAFLGKHFANAGSHIVLTPGSFYDEGGFKDKAEKEKWYNGPIPTEYVLDTGDIVVAMTEQAEGLLGSSAVIPRSGVYLHNQRLGLVRLRDESETDKRFVYYLFNTKSVRQQIRASASGVKIRHTAPTRIAEVRVGVPPFSAQRRIASVLSSYDDLIENNTRRIKILGEMTQMIFREWFVCFRFPGHEKVRMAESAFGSSPSGWPIVSFADLSEILSGGTPKTSVKEFWNGNIPFFGPTDAPKEFFVIQTEKSITPLGLSRCNSKLYPAETVFITARGTVGKVSMPSVPMAMNQSCYALRGKTGVSQLFLFMLARHYSGQLQKKAHGAVFDTITVETFEKLPVLRPSEAILEEFETLVRPYFSLLLNLQRANSNLGATRDILLPKLMSGEIEVKQLESATAIPIS
jgi:type I restriction enzyme, S subunit